MNSLKKFLRILNQTCIFFTVIIVAFYILSTSISTTLVLEISALFLLLLFAFILALCNLILRVKKIPAVVRALMHYLIVISIVLFAFFHFSSETSSFSGAIVIAAAIAIIYAIVTAIAIFISTKIKEAHSENEDYKPQFEEITSPKAKRK